MIEPYKKRQFKALENWQIEELTLKPYIMGKEIKSISQGLIDEAIRYTQKKLPKIIKGHKQHNVGYAIIHKGDMGVWLLLHCWAYEHIVLSTLAFAESGDNKFVCYDDKPFHACVWEHVVINYERDAWVKNVMSTDSNIIHYIKNKLVDGNY